MLLICKSDNNKYSKQKKSLDSLLHKECSDQVDE